MVTTARWGAVIRTSRHPCWWVSRRRGRPAGRPPPRRRTRCSTVPSRRRRAVAPPPGCRPSRSAAGHDACPSAIPNRRRARAVAACSPWGRRWATTTAGARAAATSATAFCPPWVTTTSAEHSSAHRSGDGRSGLRSVQFHPGVALRAASTQAASASRPPAPQSSRTLPSLPWPRRPQPAVEAGQTAHAPGLARPGLRPGPGVRLRRPRGEEGVGEVVGGEVGPVRALPREGDDHDGDAVQPGEQGHLHGDVDDHRGRALALDPRREGGHPGPEAPMVPRGPVQHPGRGCVVARGRQGLVVPRQLHPVTRPNPRAWPVS